jgi:hypothetical protein
VTARWFRPGDWGRATRGRHWGFVLSTDALIDCLQHVARRRSDAFSLLQCERVQEDRVWNSIYRELPVEALSIDGPWQYVVRSMKLHPVVPAPEPREGSGWPAEFAINGLILLHHPEPGSTAGPVASSIGLVNRIASERSGAVHEHRDADALFGTLKRALMSAGAEAA